MFGGGGRVEVGREASCHIPWQQPCRTSITLGPVAVGSQSPISISKIKLSFLVSAHLEEAPVDRKLKRVINSSVDNMIFFFYCSFTLRLHGAVSTEIAFDNTVF